MQDPQGELSPVAHLCTPGLTLLSTAPGQSPVRGLYTASNGNLYGCAGQFIYYIDRNWQWNAIADIIGSQPSDVVVQSTPTSFADNGTNLIMVDGSSDGYVMNILTNNPTQSYQINAANSAVTDPSGGGWLAADKVDFTDTFFVLNASGTPNFYCSGSEAVSFDPLDFAAKSAKADNLISLIVEHRVIWLFGQYTTEVWFNSGGGGAGALTNNTFPFEAMPGTFFPRGLAAKYSLARSDNQIFWLSQDLSGQGVAMRGLGYNAQRISTHAIEAEWSGYSTISDAIGFCYSQQGHTFWMLQFPTADKTWVCDATDPQTAIWHERSWLDPVSGRDRRHRANCMANAYGKVVCGDHEEGYLYELDLNNFTDNGSPIRRLVSFPHQISPQSNERLMFRKFIANMQTGTSAASGTPVTAVSCSFTAPNATDLRNYVGAGDIGATWKQVDLTSEGEIFGDSFVGAGGTCSFVASGQPLNADYTISFNAIPTAFNAAATTGNTIYAIGRAVSNSGYKAAITSTGTQYEAQLIIMGGATTSVAMGTPSSGFYEVSMAMLGTAITMSVRRTSDGSWLSPTGWVGSPTNAISITDATYSLPGQILIGGAW